jgi:hypothetical protein
VHVIRGKRHVALAMSGPNTDPMDMLSADKNADTTLGLFEEHVKT